MNLEGKVVLITGAGRANGIGAGIAKCFVKAGARVAITDLPNVETDEAIASIGGNTIALAANAASQPDMQAAVSEVINQCGKLDVLVNNAGIGGDTMAFGDDEQEASAFMRMSDEAWDQNLEANLKTAFSSTHAALPRMSDGGSIVNIASIAALGPAITLPAYGAAKAGVVHLTKTLAIELAPRRIRVNCICPGLLYTRAWELLTQRMKDQQPELANMSHRQIFESIVADITPLGGEQTPEDIGNLAVFYSSDIAHMITGQIVAVDGGISVK